ADDVAAITLFPGCIARVLDRDTLSAARTLLEALGHRVHVPEAAVCCGAMPRHAGEAALAAAVEARTRTALLARPSTRTLSCASGCLDGLRRHVLDGTGLTVEDIATFIARDPGIAGLRFRPFVARVALHVPCTQASLGDGGRATRALLARIPGLELEILPVQPRCCGAAGTYFIDHPEPADRLRAQTLEHVQASAAQLLLTSNTGCRAFLDNGLRRRTTPIPVLHPLALLARQLETAEP
ncbi:MAG: (Fe-S)-binding protein, partial [Xanthomonadales bacterium]|nr:(Fe-S)-binding protein [Xanthomonadales bacterium]